jgi:hypothetical protein
MRPVSTSKMNLSTSVFIFDYLMISVFDKGTLDAMLCGDNVDVQVSKLLSECCRVLKKDGYFIDISFGTKGMRGFVIIIHNLKSVGCAGLMTMIYHGNLNLVTRLFLLQKNSPKVKTLYIYFRKFNWPYLFVFIR